MGLDPAQQLLHYRLVEKIGEGGMGVVWKAVDTTLDREVAIKVLPDTFADDPERLARFEREAKLLASLNHANIATIHSVHEAGGLRFLAMELVAGEDLAQRLARGALPLDEALQIGVHTAEALEAAHDAGVIHRDLKPANIKLTSDDRVKVLDFGLAKALAPDTAARSAGAADPSLSPTVTSAGTVAGVILGTAAYMSPEQARGKSVDKRADIWAFGCVLYEMLTGRRPFAGSDVTDTLASVLRSEPDWQALPAATPQPLRLLLRRCLQKSPRLRLRDIADARLELEDAVAGYPGLPQPTADAARIDAAVDKRTTTHVVAVATLTLLLGLLAGFLLGRNQLPPSDTTAARTVPSTHAVITLPDSAPLALGTQYPQIGFESPALTLSPDGRHLVYVGRSGDGTRLYHRDLARFDEPRPVPGTEGAHFGFFSPDSTELGFLTQDRVKKVALDGGAATPLCRARYPVIARWIGDRVYFSDRMGFALASVPDGGGEATQHFHTFERLGALAFVSDVFPGAEAALVSQMSDASSSTEYAAIRVVSLTSDDSKVLPVTGFDARYLGSGHLLWSSGGKLMAAAFDSQRLELRGDPVPVLDSVAHDSIFGRVQLAVSDHGTVAFVPGGDLARGRLAWVDREGGEGVLDVPERVYGVFDLSHDDRRFAVQVADVRDYIWLWDAEGGGKAVASATSTWYPLWSPDGETLAFWAEANDDNAAGIMLHDLRSGTTRTLLARSSLLQPNSWARTGVLGVGSFAPSQVGVVDVAAPGDPRWVAQGTAGALSLSTWPAALAPDGAWMAYGTGQIWLQQVDGDERRQIATDGSVEPTWCRKCDELFYRQGNRIYATRITFEPELQIGSPRPVFEAVDFVDTKGMSYRVSSDGQRAYYLRRSAPPSRNRIHVIVNWSARH